MFKQQNDTNNKPPKFPSGGGRFGTCFAWRWWDALRVASMLACCSSSFGSCGADARRCDALLRWEVTLCRLHWRNVSWKSWWRQDVRGLLSTCKIRLLFLKSARSVQQCSLFDRKSPAGDNETGCARRTQPGIDQAGLSDWRLEKEVFFLGGKEHQGSLQAGVERSGFILVYWIVHCHPY